MKYLSLSIILLGLFGCSNDSNPDENNSQQEIKFERSEKQMCHFEGHVAGVVDEITLTPVFTWASLDKAKQLLPMDKKRLIAHDSTGLKLLDLDAKTTTMIWDPAPANIVSIAVDGEKIFVGTEENGIYIVKLHKIEGTTIDTGIEMVRVNNVLSVALSIDKDHNLIVAVGDTEKLAIDSEYASDGKTIQGAILRINPEDPKTPLATNPSYGDNPGFVYAVGVRNPQGCAPTQDGGLWCVDHGPKYAEMHNVRTASNLGWPGFDGLTCAKYENCKLIFEQIPQSNFERTSEDCGIMMGAEFSSSDSPQLANTLYFANTCKNQIYGFLLSSPDGYWWDNPAANVDGKITGMGSDIDGSVFVLSEKGVFVIGNEQSKVFPQKITESGCIGPNGKTKGMIPYEVNAILWTDGAEKDRWLEIPPGTIIDTSDPNYLKFPKGSVIAKNFWFTVKGKKQIFETRIMVMGSFGWEFHTYKWNEDGSDAILMNAKEEVDLVTEQDGKDVFVKHLFPDRVNCRMCHGPDLQVLGPRIDQMDMKFKIQGTEFEGLKLLRDVKYIPEEKTPKAMANPQDETQSLELRARAILHTDCAHCHRPNGWTPAGLGMDLRYDSSFLDTQTCGIRTVGGAILNHQPRIDPGNPEGSVLYKRMTDNGLEQMPPIGRSTVREKGAKVVYDWIKSLKSCPEE